MRTITSQITGVSIVCTTVAKENIKAPCHWSLWWWPVDSPHKGPVTRKMFPFDDVIMSTIWILGWMFFSENVCSIFTVSRKCSQLLRNHSGFLFVHPSARNFGVSIRLSVSPAHDWVSNRDAGDFRRHHAHFDVTVMEYAFTLLYHRQHKWSASHEITQFLLLSHLITTRPDETESVLRNAPFFMIPVFAGHFTRLSTVHIWSASLSALNKP